MKKLVSIIATVAMFVMVAGVSASFAATACSNVHVAGVATTGATPSGIAVRLKNTNTTACGSLPAGTALKYYLSTTNTDQTLAILLTAVSLGKLVWVSIAGTATEGSLLEVVSMDNPQ